MYETDKCLLAEFSQVRSTHRIDVVFPLLILKYSQNLPNGRAATAAVQTLLDQNQPNFLGQF